jgi:NADPH-ferrihemoprotein reductase
MGGVCGLPTKSPRINAEQSQIKYSTLEEKYPAGAMSVYFGSQTGTARGFAELLASFCRRAGFEVKVIDLGDFQPEQLVLSRLAIFLVATYGEGDPTDNALRFYEWLCNTEGSIPDTYLSNVSFAVFGLGNSTYVNYNQMGKRCDEKLEKLGGQRIFPLACGDDSCTLEEDFEAWKTKIVEFLAKKYAPIDDSPIEIHPKAHLAFTTQSVASPSEAVTPPPTEINTTTKYFFTSSAISLTAVRDLRSSADPGRTLHFEFNIADTKIKYNAADNLAVIPENNQTTVEEFAFCCGGYRLSQCVTLIPTEPDDDVEEFSMTTFKHPFPTPCTVQTIFQKYLDISGIPRRSTLERFGAYVKDKKQLKWLDDMISKESREKYSKEIEGEGRTYASLLANELSSCVIPLDDLLHLIPFIQPRYYTISSAHSVNPDSVHLTGTSFLPPFPPPLPPPLPPSHDPR